MSEKRIVGIDVGSYAIKVVYVDPKASELSWLGFERERVELGAELVHTAPPGPPPLPGGDVPFDDEPTGIHKAPGDADDTTDQADDSGEVAPSSGTDFSLAPDWLPALQRLAARDALSGALQATAVPDAQAVLIELDVPFAEKAKVQNILPHLMVDRLPLPQAEVTWDFQAFEKVDPSEESAARALIGFAKNTELSAVLEQLQLGGVDPAQLGIGELQLAAIGSYSVAPAGIVAFVDLGHELTRVAVVRGSEPLQGRTIRSGGKQITEAIAERMDRTFEEAETLKHQSQWMIVDEATAPNAAAKEMSEALRQGLRPVVRDLRRTFQGLFARKRIEVSRVYLCGGTSRITNIDQYLAAELGVPVERLVMRGAGFMDDDFAATGALAMGAALTQQSEYYRARAVNLRAGQFAYRGRSSYMRRQLVFAAFAMAILVGILGVSLYMEKLSYEAQRDAMKAALQTQTKSLLGAEFTTKAAIQRVLDGGDTASNSFIPNMSAYHLLHELSSTMPKDVTITLDRIEVDTDRNLIQVYGETTDAQAVDRIVSELEQGIECLKEIKKDKLRVRDDKADFELQISSGCS